MDTPYALVRITPYEGRVVIARYADRDFAYRTAAFCNFRRAYFSRTLFVVDES